MSDVSSGNSSFGELSFGENCIHDASFLYLLVVDSDCTIQYLNKKTADEYRGRPLKNIYDLSTDANTIDEITGCVHSTVCGRKNSCEVWFYFPQSGVQRVQFYFSPLEYRNETLCLIEGVTVSSRKQIEENLSEEKFRYRTILDQSVDIYLMFDMNGYIVDTNFQTVHELGYTRDELLALTIDDLDAAYSDVKQGNSPDIITYYASLKTKNGKSIPVEAKVRMITYVQISYIIGFFRNIANRHGGHTAVGKIPQQ